MKKEHKDQFNKFVSNLSLWDFVYSKNKKKIETVALDYIETNIHSKIKRKCQSVLEEHLNKCN